eukprot:750102-Hanusia_phi.AAC.2
MRSLPILFLAATAVSAFVPPLKSPFPALFGLSSRNLPCIASTRPVARFAGLSMQDLDPNKCFVSGLPWALTSEDLRDLFSEFGAIQDANVVYDRETGRSRGFGFVTFAESSDCEAAITAMDKANIGGRTVLVKQANVREARPDRRSMRSD